MDDDDDASVVDLMLGRPPALDESQLLRVRYPGSPSMRHVENSNGGVSGSNRSSSYGNMHGVLPAVGPQLSSGETSGEGAAASGAAAEGADLVRDGWHALRNVHARQQVDRFENPNEHHNVTGDAVIVRDEEGAPMEPTYVGFVSHNLFIGGPIAHPKEIPTGLAWTKISDRNIEGMRPVRAMCINIPASLIQRDAMKFAQWTMPSGNGQGRALATAALTGALFAGTAMGIPCGKHAETVRAETRRTSDSSNETGGRGNGRKERSFGPEEVKRYAYINPEDDEDELPMFRIMYEEIKNKNDTDVVFIRVWLLIFDPSHSTAELLAQVISINNGLLQSQSAAGQDPNQRNKTMTSETERRKRSGMACFQLDSNFEGTVGMQFTRIINMESYYQMLKSHAGPSVGSEGRMFVSDFDKHMDNALGHRVISGDPQHQHGSLHPAAPEFVFNAKRQQGLRFGTINLDGSEPDIHPKYLDTSSYWDDDGVFCLPVNGDLWMCASIERRTIMELSLPRPLQNQVVPGEHMMRLFIEVEDARRAKNKAVADAVRAAEATASANHPPDSEETAMDVASALDQGEEAEEEEEEEGEAEEAEGEEKGGEEDEEDEEDEEMGRDSGTDDESLEDEEVQPAVEVKRQITSSDYASFRSFATGQDETQRRDQELMRGVMNRYDIMSDSAMANTLSSSDTMVFKGDNEGTFRIKTEKMTDRIACESTRIYNGIVNMWLVDKQRSIEDRRSKLEEDGADPNGEEFNKLLTEEKEMQIRLYNVKRDLTQYHLRCIQQCFHSAHDRTTIPAGFKAMERELEAHVKENGGCASMAFPPNRPGKQITASDRQVWHELQEWLGVIFSKDALIEGRDRFIMDEMYLQSFEVYSEQRFVLIICSDRGKGKSIRAERLAKLLPAGFTSTQAASSARAGMNGNMSPNNGTMIIFDEMTKDLTPYEVDERIEFWKQILTNGEYSIERTCRSQKSDGTDSYITCEIVTDHSVSNTICTNHGPCFTPGDREPTAGKMAMVNRTICLFARTETKTASPASAFANNLQAPEIMRRVRDFRLFTCLVAFCKLTMRRCPWLQTDLGLAQKMWDQGDTVLAEEYGMPRPEPRRTQRRAELCRTQAIMEAVARVFLFKQTALQFEAGRPLEGTAVAKKFEIGDLWDVIRAASVPSRAVIRDCWVKSLTYSISTSPNGINVMTSICQLAKVGIMDVFRKMPRGSLEDLLKTSTDSSSNNQIASQALESYMGPTGAKTKDLHLLGVRMGNNRKLRMEWRSLATKTNIHNKSPIDTIDEVAGAVTEEKRLRYRNALMPSYQTIAVQHNAAHLLKWANGESIEYETNNTLQGNLAYRKEHTRGGAQQYDHAWIVIKEHEQEYIKYHPLVSDLKSSKSGSTPVNLFGYHDAGINDTFLLLETNEASRLCTEMPGYTNDMNPVRAFADERSNIPNKESKKVSIRDVKLGPAECPARMSNAPIDCRTETGGLHHSKVKVHRHLDVLVSRGRIPAAQVHTSSKITRCAPIRRANGSGVLLNTSAAFDHINMVIESSITCSKVDGLKGHQEALNASEEGGVKSTMQALCASSNGGAEEGNPNDETMTRILPFSNDLVQMNWAIDITQRGYVDTLFTSLKRFNDAVDNGHIPGEKMCEDDMPQQPLPCMGFPISPTDTANENTGSGKGSVILQLLSLKAATKADTTIKKIEVSDDIKMGTCEDNVLVNEVATSLGRKPTSGDIESYKMDRIGENYMWGVKGDLNAYRTWCNHLRASMVARGNAHPERDDVVIGLMDCELMLICRMHERRAGVKDSPESIYGLSEAWGQSYTAMIKQAKEKKTGMRMCKKRSTRLEQPDGCEMNDALNQFETNKKAKIVQPPPRSNGAISPGAGPSSSNETLGSPMATMTDVRHQ